MLHLEPNKVYKIQISFADSGETVHDVTLGSKINGVLEELQKRYPNFKRIIVFDADTGDVVAWVKK